LKLQSFNGRAQWTVKDVWQEQSWSNLRCYPGSCLNLEKLQKTCHDSLPVGLDLKLGPLKYEAEVSLTSLQSSVCYHVVWYTGTDVSENLLFPPTGKKIFLKMFLSVYKAMQCHIPKDSNLQFHGSFPDLFSSLIYPLFCINLFPTSSLCFSDSSNKLP